MIPSSPGQAIELLVHNKRLTPPKQTEPKGNCMIVLDLHTKQKQKQGVCHIVALPLNIKKYIYIFP